MVVTYRLHSCSAVSMKKRGKCTSKKKVKISFMNAAVQKMWDTQATCTAFKAKAEDSHPRRAYALRLEVHLRYIVCRGAGVCV